MTRPFDADPGRISPEGHFPSLKSEVLPRRLTGAQMQTRLQIGFRSTQPYTRAAPPLRPMTNSLPSVALAVPLLQAEAAT